MTQATVHLADGSTRVAEIHSDARLLFAQIDGGSRLFVWVPDCGAYVETQMQAVALSE